MGVVFLLLCLATVSCSNYLSARYHRRADPAPYSRGEAEVMAPEVTMERSESDCPLQCRCISLSHLGLRDMAERWMSMGRLDGVGNTFKGTAAPVWQREPEELLGRDVVCMGLHKVPRPLPTGEEYHGLMWLLDIVDTDSDIPVLAVNKYIGTLGSRRAQPVIMVDINFAIH